MTDPYLILGIDRSAEPEVIDAAYRALMKKYHPDRSGPEGLEKAKAITFAYAAVKGRAPEQWTRAPEPEAEQPSQAPEPYEWGFDYVPPPPPRDGVRFGYAMLAFFGIPLLGAAVLKLIDG